ncbi:MAG: hypothetical protein AAF532_06365 [Planctomycetota bacterium]
MSAVNEQKTAAAPGGTRRRPGARLSAAVVAALTVAAGPVVGAQDDDAGIVDIAAPFTGSQPFAPSAVADRAGLLEQESPESPGSSLEQTSFDVRESNLVPFADLDEIMNEGVRPASAGGLSFGETTRLGNAGTLGVSLGASPLSGVGRTGLNYTGEDYTVLRQAQLGVSFSEREVVINSGVTANLYESDGFAVGGRALFGGALIENIDDQFHFSGDLFAGSYSPLLSWFNDVWVKGGAFVDYQGKFGKVGPAIGVLINPQSRFPVIFDAAFGYGLGGTRTEANNNAVIVTRAADEDFQFRLGTFLSPNVEAGFTFEHAWFGDIESGFDEEDDSYGAFTRIHLGNTTWQVEVTGSEQEVNGFLNCVVQLDKPRQANLLAGRPIYSGQDWVSRPIFRDSQVRLRQIATALPPAPDVGTTADPTVPILGAVATVVLPSRSDSFLSDIFTAGVVDTGDTFELDITFTNNSTVTLANLSFGQNPTDTGNVFVNIFLPDTTLGGDLGDLAPGASVTTDSFNDIDATVFSAVDGQSIFIEFDVSANGVTDRFRAGPIIVGTTVAGAQIPVVSVNGTLGASVAGFSEAPPRTN